MIFILSSFHAVKNLSVYSFALLGSALYLPVLTSTLQSSLNCSSSNKVREIAFHLTSDCRIIKMIHLSFYHEKLKYCNKGSSQSEIKRTRSIKNSLSQFSQKNFKWKDSSFTNLQKCCWIKGCRMLRRGGCVVSVTAANVKTEVFSIFDYLWIGKPVSKFKSKPCSKVQTIEKKSLSGMYPKFPDGQQE